MKLSEIHNTFRGWVKDLKRQGLEAVFTHDLKEEKEGPLIVSAILLSAMLDPKRRAHGSARGRAPNRPLARLRYLIAVGSSAHGIEAEQALLELLVLAQHTPGITLLVEAPSSSWWLASGVAPRPAFMLEAAVSEALKREPAKPVREIQIDLGSMCSVHGRVVAADTTPIAGAEIQLLTTGQIIHSDHRGAFRFQISASGPDQNHGHVRVRARGVEQRFEIPGPATSQSPWLIQLDQLGS
jgi:hypothetical protein